MKSFKETTPLEQRIDESQQIINKYPDRIPVIVEKYFKCELPDVDKCKYLVPKDMTMTKFIFVIRKRIKLESTQALFITINHTMVPAPRLIGELYNEMKDEDGFLYVTYTGENTFG